MGNSVSGTVSARLHRIIKDESIFAELLVASQSNISIDMDPERRVHDPYNSSYKLSLCDQVASEVVLLFPHHDRPDLKVLYAYKYKRFASLQRDINARIKNTPEKEEGVDLAHRVFNQMVVCWGDFTYKLSGLNQQGNVYLLWATQIRSVSGTSKTRLYVTPDGSGVPVVVLTNGHYKPLSIFPIHPGEPVTESHRARPTLLDPAKSKIFWHEEAILFCLDKPYPKDPVVKVEKKTALQVKSDVNEYASPSSDALVEGDDYLMLASDEEMGEFTGYPPLNLVQGTALTQFLSVNNTTITYVDEEQRHRPNHVFVVEGKGKQEEEEEEVEVASGTWVEVPTRVDGVVKMVLQMK